MNIHDGNTRSTMLVLLALAVGLGGGHVSAEQGHEHGHAAHTLPPLTLDEGRLWATDAPLRTGMERIREAAAPLLHRKPSVGVTAGEAEHLAGAIRDSVAYMVENCGLTPQADATLHVLIGDLLGGANALAAGPSVAESLQRIANALDQYPRYFDHPGWLAPAEHGH